VRAFRLNFLSYNLTVYVSASSYGTVWYSPSNRETANASIIFSKDDWSDSLEFKKHLIVVMVSIFGGTK
jgi:hypothetical protein